MADKKDIFEFIKKRPSETPDSDYFDSLADSVLSKVSEENASENKSSDSAKIIPLYRRPAFWLSGAAAAILVVFLMLPDKKSPVIDNGEPSFEDLSKSEVLAYVDYNIEDFDVELLAEFIPANKLNTEAYIDKTIEETTLETETSNPDLEESLESISPQEILEYLETEGLDPDDLEDELFM